MADNPRPGRQRAAERLLIVLLFLVAVAYRGLAALLVPTHPPAAFEGADEWFFSPQGGPPFLVLGVAALILVNRLPALQRTSGNPALPTRALLLAPAVVLGCWAYFVQAADLLLPSLAMLLLGLGALLGGMPAWRLLLFPSLFLVFAIPPPAVLVNQVMLPLQLASASINGALLNAFGGQAYAVGDQIWTATRRFQVIEECSGLRSIETLLMASALYTHLFHRGRLQSGLIIASAPLVAFLANQLRILSIVLNPLSDFAAIHTIQGLVMLVGGVLLLAAIDRGLSRCLAPHPPQPLGLERQTEVSRTSWSWRFAIAVGVVALLAASSLWSPHWTLEKPTAISLPQPPEGWRVRGQTLDKTFFGSVKFSESIFRRYLRGDEAVRVFVGSSFHAARGTHVLSDKTGIMESGWTIEEQGSALVNGRKVDLLVTRFIKQHRLAYRWYIGVSSPGSEFLRAFLALDRGPFARLPGRAVVVVVSTDVTQTTGGEAGARLRLNEVAAFAEAGLMRSNPWLAAKAYREVDQERRSPRRLALAR